MRILYIIAGAGDMFCGSCLRDNALAGALQRQGHDVLICPTYTPLKTESGEGFGPTRVFYGGVNVFLQQKIGLFRHSPRFLDRWFDHPALLRFVSRFSHMTAAKDLAQLTLSVLEGEDGRQVKELHRFLDYLRQQPPFDAVLLPNTLFSGLAGALGDTLDAPVFSLLSGEDMFVEEFPKALKKPIRELLCRQAARLDGLIAHNHYYARFMADYLDVPEEKTYVAPLGVDTTDYPKQTPAASEQFTIGFLARVCWHKGLHLLAEAFHILKKKPDMEHCRLRVAGYLGGEHRAYLDDVKKKIEKWGLTDVVSYEGELDRTEKIRFLSELNVFSVPAVYPEPKGRFVPEAMAAGVPVVLPRLGCFPEWMDATGGGLLCEPNDAESLAEKLAELARDPARAQSLGDAGRRAVRERFSAENMATSVIGILSEGRTNKPRKNK